MRDLKFYPILDLLPPEAKGFSVEVANCQESFEFLRNNGYVDFDLYQSADKPFITSGGYHCFDKRGVFRFGKIFLYDDFRKVYPPFPLSEFLNICDNAPGDPYSSEVSLFSLLQEG